MKACSPSAQLGLLEWTPPEPVVRFDADQVRAATIGERISRAVTLALKDHALPREEIAQRMSDYLGTRVSVNVLNAYASQARGDHSISVVRFCALLHATGDRRLLELLAGMNGWAVVEQRQIKMIRLATAQDREAQARRERQQRHHCHRQYGVCHGRL